MLFSRIAILDVRRRDKSRWIYVAYELFQWLYPVFKHHDTARPDHWSQVRAPESQRHYVKYNTLLPPFETIIYVHTTDRKRRAVSSSSPVVSLTPAVQYAHPPANCRFRSLPPSPTQTRDHKSRTSGALWQCLRHKDSSIHHLPRRTRVRDVSNWIRSPASPDTFETHQASAMAASILGHGLDMYDDLDGRHCHLVCIPQGTMGFCRLFYLLNVWVSTK